MAIISDTSITPILSSDDVTAETANTAHDELKVHIETLNTYLSAQVEDWIVIDSEGDYATLTAYLADAPAAGDRILVKEDQTVTVQTGIPSDVTIKFLDGANLLSSTAIATSLLKMGSNVIIEGVLNIVMNQAGTTAKAVEFDGDNVVGKINVSNVSSGIVTTAYHINGNKTGNRIDGFVQNTGGGTLTNYFIDNSTEDSNLLILVDAANNIIRTNGTAFVDLLNPQDIAGEKTLLSSPILKGTAPSLRLEETGVAADNGKWAIAANGEILTLAVVNDAESSSSTALAISRTDTTVDTINLLPTNLQHNGTKIPTVSSTDTLSNKSFSDLPVCDVGITLVPGGTTTPTHSAPLGTLWVGSNATLWINENGATQWIIVGLQN
jgi:hypothetical protein